MAVMGRFMPNSPALASSLANGLGVMLGGIAFFFVPRGWFTTAVLVTAVLASGAAYAWALALKFGTKNG
jgi:VIT1/CCC1 family predicted Fe2+/Mn2+ transporter